MSTKLYLKSVNVHLEKNKLDHHTSNYMSKKLILRRGQAFQITLSLNRALKTQDNVTFVVETGKTPNAAKGTKATFSLSKSEAAKGRWKAVPNNTASTSLTIWITPPVTAIIGTYRFSPRLFSGGYTSHKLPELTLLFNPWATDDDVYLANESERQEYVLNDSTIIYHGNENLIGARGWNLGQFEEEILGICLLLLEKQKIVDVSLLRDPKAVSRVCSAMVNSNDDKGVLQGNWSGKYENGLSPTSWSGSVAILKKWASSGPVRYGQCWVFAGVLCTVMRCLGIPNRIVTNFNSAHDTDENLSIDTLFDENGRNPGGEDSVWNFHVWNEAWFTRDDIGSYYNGWQVLDATPQEKSNEIYRLGPTSVKAIKEGDVHLLYDGPFVFSEVNADEISWIYRKEGDSFERIKTNTSSIGKCISTKAVGSGARIDITSSYKNKEGTPEEREAFHNALLNLYGRQTVAKEVDTSNTHASTDVPRMSRVIPAFKQDISGKFKKIDTPELGQDIDLILVLVNEASSNKTIAVTFNAKVTGYTRRVMKNFSMESVSISMASKEEKEITFKIPYSKYINNLLDDEVVEVTALCKWDEAEKLLVSQVITLKNPSLTIKASEDAVVNKPLSVEVTFNNPLNESLTDCKLVAEGSGLIKDQIEKKISLKPKEKTTVTIEFTPYTKGSKQLNIVVCCNKIVTINGFIIININ
ncbi:protein-glutamine gamma-glutamyltransferase 6-like [Pyxicephalus adspersus]|uniref:protein-glutamine gamma-glutamyltransferase 6-like n=1 Tax=Pyxicephalus adspersus TaxID=30357 RepID=UPI003B590B4E